MQVAAPAPEELRRLVGLRLERPLVLSLYLNLDPTEFATPPARATAIRSLLDDADRRLRERADLSHEDSVDLRASLERARNFLERELPADGSRAVALFAAESAGLFEALRLPQPVRNRVAIGRTPMVGPLAALGRREAWCLMLVNRREGRLFRGGPDRLRELGSIHDDVHGQHDQGGWSQARYQRSVDKEAADHLRHAAAVLFRHYRRLPFENLLLGGPAEVVSDFEPRLHDYLAERVRGRVDVDVEHSTPDEVLEAARPRFEQIEREREDEALARVESGARAAAGLEDVLTALNERRVETLIGNDRSASPGAACPACGWLTSEAGGRCPADGKPLEPLEDVTEAAIELALQQSAEVRPVRHRLDELEAQGGIAALLRF